MYLDICASSFDREKGWGPPFWYVLNLSSDKKPNTCTYVARPTPANQSEKRERKEGRSRYSCCVIGSRNRLRNLFEGVSRAIFNADSEYAKGFLWLSLYFSVSGWVSHHCVVPTLGYRGGIWGTVKLCLYLCKIVRSGGNANRPTACLHDKSPKMLLSAPPTARSSEGVTLCFPYSAFNYYWTERW